MKNFFNSENFLWQWFAHLADYFLLSCMWLICCIPVVTVGSASIALYDTVAHCIRGKEPDMFRRFFRTFKNELGRGIALTLVWAVLAALLGAGYQIMTQLAAENAGMALFQMVYFFLLLLPLGVLCWAVAIESRFTNSFAGLHRMAVIFTFAHLPHTAAIVALLVVQLNVLINFPFFALFLPGMVVTFQSWFIEKVFSKYTPSDEAGTDPAP